MVATTITDLPSTTLIEPGATADKLRQVLIEVPGAYEVLIVTNSSNVCNFEFSGTDGEDKSTAAPAIPVSQALAIGPVSEVFISAADNSGTCHVVVVPK